MLAVLTSIGAAAADSESMQIGFGKDRSVTFLSVKDRGTGGSALYLPEATMGTYKECRITEMHIDLGEPTGKDSVRVFITRSLDEAPLYEQHYTAAKSGWNTIVLDTPFEIDGSALYIGYEVTGQYYLLYRNSFVDGEEWIRQDEEGWKKYDGIYTASFYATVEGDNLPKNNIRIGNIKMPAYAVTGEPLDISGSFINLGLDDVNQLTFTCSIDGQPAGETVVDVNKTAYTGSGTFKFSGFGMDTSGDKSVSITVSAVNGQDDCDPSDNTSATRKVTVVDNFVKRNILFEVFSTEKCTSCPSQHQVIASTFKDMTDIIEVGHHAGYYEDKFTIPDSKEYEWFYGNGRLYAPAVMFDRTSFGENLPDFFTGESPLTSFNSTLLVSAYNEALNVPAFADVDISCKLDSDNRKLDLTVSGKQLIPLTRTDDVRLFVYLTEDSIYTETQAGASEGFYQRYVIRQNLTGTWGDEINVEEGFSKTFSTDIPDDCNIDMTHAVAFMGYYTPDDPCGCNVLNSAEYKIADSESSGIEIIDTDRQETEIMFDGDNIIVPGGYDELSVLDMSGACIMRRANGSTFTQVSHLAGGIYIVKVCASGKTNTLKLRIK